MSLDWGLHDIDGWRTLCYEGEEDDRRMNPVTNTLIWETMSIGIPRITEKTWEEFARRIHISQQIHGGYIYKIEDHVKKYRFVTAAEVKSHIGLHTNASSKTKTVFMKDIYFWMEKMANGAIKKEKGE